MKKLILIIFLIPNFSIAQMLYGNSTITYKDIMSIDSKDSYVSLMIDNGYTYLKEEDDGFSNTVFYLLNPTNKNGAILSTSTSWYMEYSSKRIIYFDLSRRGLDDGRIYNNTYDEIRKKVDKKCKYVKNIDFGNNIFKAYSCKKAKFDGLIGFALREDGFGMIKTFPSE